jgi:hypothetical protein
MAYDESCCDACLQGAWPDGGRLKMLIGVAGKKRSGKDTTAKFLVEDHGFKAMAFAEPLKDAAKTIFGWGEEHVNGELKEVEDPFWGFSPRWALQHMGTEAMRKNIDDEIWVKATMRKAMPLVAKGGNIVITDVRFPNEAQAIRDAGGRLWRVERLGLETSDHASETALDDFGPWDMVIDNSGSISDLYSHVYDAMKNA